MSEKYINSRVILKHDTVENWEKAVNFIPQSGEIIIYEPDHHQFYPYTIIPRIKIGDGKTLVGSLPFLDDGQIRYGYSEPNNNTEGAAGNIYIHRYQSSKDQYSANVYICKETFYDSETHTSSITWEKIASTKELNDAIKVLQKKIEIPLIYGEKWEWDPEEYSIHYDPSYVLSNFERGLTFFIDIDEANETMTPSFNLYDYNNDREIIGQVKRRSSTDITKFYDIPIGFLKAKTPIRIVYDGTYFILEDFPVIDDKQTVIFIQDTEPENSTIGTLWIDTSVSRITYAEGVAF